MEPIFIYTENAVSLYFFCAKKNSVELNRFYDYLGFLQSRVGKKWDLTCDKCDLKYVDQTYPNIFSFDGKMITLNSDRETLKSFLKETPPEFIDKALTLSKQYFVKKPEAPYYNYNEERSL